MNNSKNGSTLAEPCDSKPLKSEEVISSKVMELDLEELYQANRLLNQSEALYQLNRLNDLIISGYVLNSLEQRLFDKFIENYHIKYKSPLANSMKEGNEE